MHILLNENKINTQTKKRKIKKTKQKKKLQFQKENTKGKEALDLFKQLNMDHITFFIRTIKKIS